MTEQELIEKIDTVLADEFEVDRTTITPEAPLLETLDLAGIPLHADARGEGDPLVLGGGPCAFPDFKELKTFRDFYDLIISRTNGK